MVCCRCCGKQHYLELLEIPAAAGGGLAKAGAGAGLGDKAALTDLQHADNDDGTGSELESSLGSPHKSKRSRTTFSEDQLKVLQVRHISLIRQPCLLI